MATKQGSSQLLTTGLQLIDGYNKWDIGAILEPRAANCTHQELPARLNHPELNNEAYRSHFAKFSHLFTRYCVEILDTVEDAARHKVVFHATSDGETAIGEYTNEYMLVLQMTDDDKQVVKVRESVDFGHAQGYFRKLKTHFAAAKAEAGSSAT